MFPLSLMWSLPGTVRKLSSETYCKMGIIFQRTCFDAPAFLGCSPGATKKCQGRLSAQEMPRGRQEINELLDLARVMADVSVLDPALFTHDQELTATVEASIERLFPSSFERRRIGRTFRKIAENTLVRGIRSKSRGIPSPVISEERLKQYSEHCRVPIWVVEAFEYICPELTGNIRRVQIWADLYAVSKECSEPAWFQYHLRGLQVEQAFIDLGLPSQSDVNAHNAAELEMHALNFDIALRQESDHKEAKALLQDLVVVRADHINTTKPSLWAYC